MNNKTNWHKINFQISILFWFSFSLEETWPENKNWNEKHGLRLATGTAKGLQAHNQIRVI